MGLCGCCSWGCYMEGNMFGTTSRVGNPEFLAQTELSIVYPILSYLPFP